MSSKIGPDGLAREASVITYTEKVIEEEHHQLRKYIEENYSKIRDVEREFASLSMEMKLTAGPKKSALEHLRKKIEMATEKIHAAKLKEDQAKKAWEAAAKVVKDEEVIKQKLCEDLNSLVQESSNTQFSNLEELKKRLEALNPTRAAASVSPDGNSMGHAQSVTAPDSSQIAGGVRGDLPIKETMETLRSRMGIINSLLLRVKEEERRKATMEEARDLEPLDLSSDSFIRWTRLISTIHIEPGPVEIRSITSDSFIR